MKDKDYYNLVEMVNVGGGFLPHNYNATELCDQSRKGEVLTFREVTNRDLRFHRCYFSLLNFIYEYMPENFRQTIPEDKFYQWLKHLKKEYKVVFKFADGTIMVEYDSISFVKMSQKQFETFIREQLPYIYENVLGKYFEGEILNGIIATIEEEYKKFLAKL